MKHLALPIVALAAMLALTQESKAMCILEPTLEDQMECEDREWRMYQLELRLDRMEREQEEQMRQLEREQDRLYGDQSREYGGTLYQW